MTTKCFTEFEAHRLNFDAIHTTLRGFGSDEKDALKDALMRYQGHVGYWIGGAGFHATGCKQVLSVEDNAGILGGRGGLVAIVMVEGSPQPVEIWTTHGREMTTTGSAELGAA